jgi:hypothetical protein
MSVFEEIENFEKQSVSMIIYNLIKWYMVDRIEMETYSRPEVESSVWIQLRITVKEKSWYVEGQRLDIVKRRLIEWFEKNLNS